MTDVDHYIRAATRDNTRLSYRAAIEHFESHWGGFLPATADSVARYLVDYANTLSVNTLRQRLAGLAAWHLDQGFPDPTKAPHVKKVLKGIAELHPVVQKQAKPIQLDQLTLLVNSFDRFIENGVPKEALQSIRDKALLLIGFWRAFRSDELARLCVEHIQAEAGKGMEIFVPRSKGDHSRLGRRYKAPALQQLCPVEAYLDWISAAQLQSGPVFRSINRWGQVSDDALHPASIIGIIKKCCTQADIDEANLFSSHSLRRGFATWANAQGWDTKSLMEYVGWKDVQSAMRYIDTPDPFAQYRSETGMAKGTAQIERDEQQSIQSLLEVLLVLEPYSKLSKRTERAKKMIERHCLSPWSMKKTGSEGRKYEITVEHSDGDSLDEILDELLHQMHQIASENQCMLEVNIRNPRTDKHWD
ncbi:Tyrosine recombinase XerD [Thalassocella blandensis]|nr:Tyrosine recombinase XerD [Thalassocella blandensis]